MNSKQMLKTKIRRFDSPLYSMFEHPNEGDYVLYSDYQKLQQQIEDMKCCGNCNGSYTTPNDACFCARYLKPTNAGYYCKTWQSDGLTRKEREIE